MESNRVILYEYYSFLPLIKIAETTENPVVISWIGWTVNNLLKNNRMNLFLYKTIPDILFVLFSSSKIWGIFFWKKIVLKLLKRF